MKKKWKKYRNGWLLVAPLMIGCLIFYAIPFLMVLWYSFRSSAGRSGVFVGFSNYLEMLENEMFRLACWNTFRFLLAGLPLILLLSYLIALLLKKQAQKHMFLKSVLLLPYIMPIVGTVLLVELLFEERGVVNRILMLTGAPVEKWLESPWAFWIVVGLYLWKNAGYSVVLLLAVYDTLNLPKKSVRIP